MQFTITHSYEKDTQTVFNTLTDETYLMQKFAATGAKNIKVIELGPTSEGHVVHLQMEIPSNPPEILKKFIRPMNAMTSRDVWTSTDKETKSGGFVVDIKGVPISLTGKSLLKPTNKGCDYIIEFEAKCGIPFIGGKLLSLVEKDTRANQQMDYAFTKKYLEGV